MTDDGTDVVPNSGSVAVRVLADRAGLTRELSKTLTRRSFIPRHGRQVLVDVAVMSADCREPITDIDMLRHQSQVLGSIGRHRRCAGTS